MFAVNKDNTRKGKWLDITRDLQFYNFKSGVLKT